MRLIIPALCFVLGSGCSTDPAYDAEAIHTRDVSMSRGADSYVQVRVTKVVVNYSAEPRPDGKRLLQIHAAGTAPKTGYLEPMLLPEKIGSVNGWLQYAFLAIPNVEEGILGETPIIGHGEYLFDPRATGVIGVRVFGADGTMIEARPGTEPPPT